MACFYSAPLAWNPTAVDRLPRFGHKRDAIVANHPAVAIERAQRLSAQSLRLAELLQREHDLLVYIMARSHDLLGRAQLQQQVVEVLLPVTSEDWGKNIIAFSIVK
jgi:hypothetical protein